MICFEITIHQWNDRIHAHSCQLREIENIQLINEPRSISVRTSSSETETDQSNNGIIIICRSEVNAYARTSKHAEDSDRFFCT